jgi:hypothetical protein
MKLVALSALATTASAATVTCKFTVDNKVHNVYIDGQDKTRAVRGQKNNWTKKKTITFDSSATSMAIFASDYENGCRNGGLAMVCSTRDRNSPWNMDTSNANMFVVASSRNANDKPASNWQAKNYNPTGQRWSTPIHRGNSWIDDKINSRVGDICSGVDHQWNNNKFWFRFSTKTVTCKFTVDNHLHQIYLDGVSKNGDVAGHRSDWTKQKTISFPSSTKSMAIFATDYEQGCKNGGMAMKCFTPVKSSKWNMDTSHTNDFLVASSRNYNDAPATNWMATNYDTTTSSRWGKPIHRGNSWIDDKIGESVGDICSSSSQQWNNNQFWFRFMSETKAPTAHPTKQPTEKPTDSPTKSPTKKPTMTPTSHPTESPTEKCNADNCMTWSCADWCECYDETAVDTYESHAGCQDDNDDTCICFQEETDNFAKKVDAGTARHDKMHYRQYQKHKVVCGRHNPRECREADRWETDLAAVHEVRCCSDVIPTNALKQKRGMKNCANPHSPGPSVKRAGGRLSGIPGVWGMSKVGNTGDMCVHSATFDEAVAICAAIPNGRLCTENELKNECTSGTGCMHDFDLIWTKPQMIGVDTRK